VLLALRAVVQSGHILFCLICLKCHVGLVFGEGVLPCVALWLIYAIFTVVKRRS